MTAAEAERAYQELSDARERPATPGIRHIAARVLSGLAAATDAIAAALNRASYGLEHTQR